MFKKILFKPLLGIATVLFVLASVHAENAEKSVQSVLSSRQQQVIFNEIKTIRSPAELGIAMAWSDAKKVSEIMCRPAALKYFKKQYKNADRVFLGDEQNDSLKLNSNQVLTGTGQVREDGNWRYFIFTCQLNPATGFASSFKADITSTQSYTQPEK